MWHISRKWRWRWRWSDIYHYCVDLFSFYQKISNRTIISNGRRISHISHIPRVRLDMSELHLSLDLYIKACHSLYWILFSYSQNLKCFTNFSEAAESQSDVKKSFLAIFVWSSCRPLLLGAPKLQYPRDRRHCLQAWSSFCHKQAFTEAPPLSTWKEAQLGHEILTGNNSEAKFEGLQMLILSNLAALQGYVFLWGKSVGAHAVIFMKMMQMIKKVRIK